jgi:riboflavin kinase/FMN adenylyltransferase
VQGDQRGRTIGWPTANLNTHGRILPADGVYAGEATLPDGRCVIAAISIGTKPTFDGTTRTCESTLLAADGQAIELPLDWYGWNIRLRFMSWIRAQERFDSVHTLLDELERDRARIIRVMSVSRAV